MTVSQIRPSGSWLALARAMFRLLFFAPALVAPAALAQLVYPAGKWELHTDKNGAGLYLLAETRVPIPNPADPRRGGSLPLMVVQCEKGKPEFFVNLNYEFELPGSRLPVRYRLDGGEVNDAVWLSDEGGGVAIYPDEPVGLVRAMLGKRTLELSFTMAGKPGTARFDITGLDKALTFLTPHCQW